MVNTECFNHGSDTSNSPTVTPTNNAVPTLTSTAKTSPTTIPSNSPAASNSQSGISSGVNPLNGAPSSDGPAGPGGPPPGGFGGPATVTGTAAYSQSGRMVSKSNETITASNQNESAIKITERGIYNLTDSTVSTTGDSSSMDSSSFYGLNAAVLAESGSKITLSNVKVNTTGSGANGVFATGQGSTIDLNNVTINCTNTGAHGVDATLAGTLNLNNVNITTAGNGASAAIATDRGGGTINVTGGIVTTSGFKSPPIYSTGNITVTGANMKATDSEAVAIEGKNSVTLNEVMISGAKNWGVIIYQSMSGDAATGTGNFNMTGGILNAEEGPLFYSTNTQAFINLKGATLVNPSEIILKASAGDWGTTGSNGADVILMADAETLNGNVICDNISTVNLTLKNKTSLKGAINIEHTAKSVVLSLDNTSVWEISADSYITGLTDTDTTLANIYSNGHTVYYDASDNANSWLKGQTYDLNGGGKLAPAV
jgi:hypothetical protein